MILSVAKGQDLTAEGDKKMNDESIEKGLEELGLLFEYVPKVLLVEIDLERSLHNQARIAAPIEENHVKLCEAQMLHDNYPPLVLRRVPNGKLVVMDGNHRTVATRNLGLSEYPYGAYIVECTDTQAVMYSKTVNNKHGLLIKDEERPIQAAYFVFQGLMNQKEAAEKYGIAPSRVSALVVGAQMDEKAARLGIKGLNNLSLTARTELFRLKSDTLFAATAAVAIDRKMNTEALQSLAQRVERAPSEATALSIIHSEEATARIIKANTVSPKNTKVHVIFLRIEKLEKLAKEIIRPTNLKMLPGQLAIEAFKKFDVIIDLIEVCRRGRK